MPDYRTVPGPSFIHPFSNVVASDDLIFVTGIASPLPTAGEQTRAIFAEIGDLLAQVGSSWSEVVYVKQAVTDAAYIDEVVAITRELLPEPTPAAGIFQIVQLVHPDLKVEIEVIAQRGARLLPPE